MMNPDPDQITIAENAAPEKSTTSDENRLIPPEESPEIFTARSLIEKNQLAKTRDSMRILGVIEENCSFSGESLADHGDSTESLASPDKQAAIQIVPEINPPVTSPMVENSENVLPPPNETTSTTSAEPIQPVSVESTVTEPATTDTRAVALPSGIAASTTLAIDHSSGYSSGSHPSDTEVSRMPSYLQRGRNSYLRLTRVSHARTMGSVMLDFDLQYRLLERVQSILAGDHGPEVAEITLTEMTRQATITLGSTLFPSSDSISVKPFLVFDEDKSFHYAFIYDDPGHTYMANFMAKFFPAPYLDLQREVYSQMIALQRPPSEESESFSETVEEYSIHQHEHNFVTSTPCQRQPALPAPMQRTDGPSVSTTSSSRPRATKALTPSLNAEAEVSLPPVHNRRGRGRPRKESTSSQQLPAPTAVSKTIEPNDSPQPTRRKRPLSKGPSASDKFEKGDKRASHACSDDQSSVAPNPKRSKRTKTSMQSISTGPVTRTTASSSGRSNSERNTQVPTRKKRRSDAPFPPHKQTCDSTATRRRSYPS